MVNRRTTALSILTFAAVVAAPQYASALPGSIGGYWEGRVVQQKCIEPSPPALAGSSIVVPVNIRINNNTDKLLDAQPVLNVYGRPYLGPLTAVQTDGIKGPFVHNNGTGGEIKTLQADLKITGNIVTGYKLTGTLKGAGSCGEDEMLVELSKP